MLPSKHKLELKKQIKRNHLNVQKRWKKRKTKLQLLRKTQNLRSHCLRKKDKGFNQKNGAMIVFSMFRNCKALSDIDNLT